MRRSAAGRRFYRLTRTSPPTEDDFVPQGQRPGYQIRAAIDPALREAIMRGVSVFDAERAARAQNDLFGARPSGSTFGFIATLAIAAESAIECDDAFRNEHHWDLYGTPAQLLACVTPSDTEL
jgi:hypothetical protein